MAERTFHTRIHQNRLINWGVEGYARHNAETTVYGTENIEKVKELLIQGVPVQLYPNHLSHADGPVLAIELKKLSPEVAKKLRLVMGSVIRGNLLTYILMHAYSGFVIPSQRRKPDSPEGWKVRELQIESTDKAAEQALRDGNILVNFAEASRSRERKMVKVDDKIARYFYFVPKTHVVPIGIWGTENVLPPEKILARHAEVFLSIGRPIPVKELEDRIGESASKDENDQKLVDELMREVAKLLPPEYRGHYAEVQS